MEERCVVDGCVVLRRGMSMIIVIGLSVVGDGCDSLLLLGANVS